MTIILRNPIPYLPCLHLTSHRYTVILNHLQALQCKAKLLGLPHLQTCHITVTLRTAVLAACQYLIVRLVSEIIRNSRHQIAGFPKAYAPFQGPKATSQDQVMGRPTTDQTKHKPLMLTMSLAST